MANSPGAGENLPQYILSLMAVRGLLLACWSIVGMAAEIQVHGHRGARAVLPENTLPAFEYAIAAGADAIELDLAVTRDNVLVVSHDPTLNPAICTSPGGSPVIRQLTLAELRRWDCGSLRHPEFPRQNPVPGARIPTLEEVLALAARGDFLFNIETKLPAGKPELAPPPEEFARLVVEAVRRQRLESRVMVQSFDFRTLHATKKLAPEIPLAALYSRDDRDFVSVAREAGAEIVAPHYSLVTADRVRAAHEAGLRVIPWTANEEPLWARLVAAGVDGIITDDPAGLIDYLRRRGLRRTR
jgi:glycerophosphoryl diester phosphodiesterase